jgi:hypothetical protein
MYRISDTPDTEAGMHSSLAFCLPGRLLLDQLVPDTFAQASLLNWKQLLKLMGEPLTNVLLSSDKGLHASALQRRCTCAAAAVLNNISMSLHITFK